MPTEEQGEAKEKAKSGVKEGTQPQAKEGSKSGVKEGTKAEVKEGAKSGAKPGVKPGAKSGVKAGVKPEAKEGARERPKYQRQSTGGIWIVLGVLGIVLVLMGLFVWFFLWNV